MPLRKAPTGFFTLTGVARGVAAAASVVEGASAVGEGWKLRKSVGFLGRRVDVNVGVDVGRRARMGRRRRGGIVICCVSWCLGDTAEGFEGICRGEGLVPSGW